MRVISLTFALWYDPLWRSNARLAWRQRRYWLACPPANAARGRAFALQVGPVTFKLIARGRETLEHAGAVADRKTGTK